MKITIEFTRERRTDVLIDEVAQGYTTHPGWLPTCAEHCPHFADPYGQVPVTEPASLCEPRPRRRRWWY